jgi:murein DD-endopeptidase MepM/ murein hydrolase activator NlpD
MPKRRYVFDPADLQFRHHRLPWKTKLLNFSLWFVLSVVIAFVYNVIYQHFFESAKVVALTRDIQSIKLKYTILNKKFDNTQLAINDFRLSDERRYRPILNLDSIPLSNRQPGYGGVDRVSGLTGYLNSDLLIKTKTRMEDIKNEINIQEKSFSEVSTKAIEQKTMMEYLPIIRPVRGTDLGDKMGFRPQHPVTGEPKWHWGQDFRVPPGTTVFATGAGKVVESGWSSGGFGNYVVIDHGYGYRTTYGHLSSIEVSKGLNVKRGDLIGLSGSTGISSGPHLHYQIDLFGKHENPLSYFDNNFTEEDYSDMIQTLSAGRY